VTAPIVDHKTRESRAVEPIPVGAINWSHAVRERYNAQGQLWERIADSLPRSEVITPRQDDALIDFWAKLTGNPEARGSTFAELGADGMFGVRMHGRRGRAHWNFI
jgi:hypothetical protein